MQSRDEKQLQEQFTWARSSNYADYGRVLGYYQVQACLEHARGKSLLDLPCGDGTLTELFVPRFGRVVGVDASSRHLAEAKRRLPAVEFHEALIEDLELPSRFDTVVMLNVLEHVADPVPALRKAASLLARDGILLVHVPNAEAVNRQIAVLMGTLTSCEELSPFDIQVAGHRRSYTMQTLEADVLSAGLELVAKGGVFYKMLSTPQIDWFLKNGRWQEGEFGWGRMGVSGKDWRQEFCRACYEFGKSRPRDCNIIYVGAKCKG